MKSCVMCFEPIPYYQTLCRVCYEPYKAHMQEAWFIELVKMQRLQDAINTREVHYIPYNEYTDEQGRYMPKVVSEPKGRGRPPKSYIIKNLVLQIYDQHNGNISLRRLSTHIEATYHHKINKDTINTLLKKHRPKSV